MAFSGAKRANTKYWTSCARTTTTQSDSMEVAPQTQVSVHLPNNLSKVILENGDEVNLLPYGINKEFRTKCLIGNGVIVDPKVLLSDFKAL